MGQNATYLTDKYPGREDNLWTPCIFEFFVTHRPKLPVSVCKNNRSIKDPYFEKRKYSETIKIEGEVLKTNDKYLINFLPEIDNIFKSNLNSYPRRNTLAGISPDIFIIRPNREGVYIIENKPYYKPAFTGNQGPGQAYIEFVRWLYRNDIHCEYLLIHTACCAGETYEKIKQIQDELPSHFGVLLLEHIFMEMHNTNFPYLPISDKEKWIDYTDTKPDY
ncbi:MAG: hypothetical protein WAK96_14340 [Desulfobaccales bacterium]